MVNDINGGGEIDAVFSSYREAAAAAAVLRERGIAVRRIQSVTRSGGPKRFVIDVRRLAGGVATCASI